MERTAVWKTVPPTERSIRVNPINPCSKKKLGGKTNTDSTDSTDFIRWWYSLNERSIRVNPINQCSKKRLGGGETNMDCTDITDFIRDATWYWIYYGLHLRLYGAGCLQQEIIRDNPSARQAQINPTTQKNPWKNRSVASVLSVIVFEHGERAKGEQAHQWGTVFQTALLLFLLVIPRLRPGLLSLRSVLSSRQNLLQTTNMERSAGFQTKLITNYKHGV